MYYAMMDPKDKPPTSYKLICVGPEEKAVVAYFGEWEF